MIEQAISMEKIIGNTNRRYGGEGDLKVLAEDMKVNGLINPITLIQPDSVNPELRGYEIVAGRRRFAAAKLLGWTEIRSRVLEPDEYGKAESIAGSENINRLAMHPLDEAELFQKLIENGELIESLAKRYDRKKSEIWQRTQLLNLSGGIKEFFRAGRMDLQSAAMLAKLDEKQQEAFGIKVKDFYSKPWNGSVQINESFVSNFYSEISGDHLYKFIASNKECETCKNRTFFTDKELFPEMMKESDICFDHDCYVKKWHKVIGDRIKTIARENKSHSEAEIIAVNCVYGKEQKTIAKILGNTVELNGVNYSVRKYEGNGVKDTSLEGTKPCFYIFLSGENLHVEAKYWIEKQKSNKNPAEKKENAFAPMVKLLDLSKPESEKIIATLGTLKKSAGEQGNNISEKVFLRVIKKKANAKDDIRDIVKFLKNNIRHNDRENEILKLFAATPELLSKMSAPKIFAYLNACDYGTWELPGIYSFGKKTKCEMAEWAGISMLELKEMYKEEIKALVAAAAAPAKEKKPIKKAAKAAPAKPKAKPVKPKPKAKVPPVKTKPAKVKPAKAKLKTTAVKKPLMPIDPLE